MTEATSAVARGLSTGWETWRAFWFQPQQMYALGFVRIAFSALVIVWTLWLLPVRTSLLGPDGISTAQPSIPDTWGLFAVWNSDEAILIGIVVLLVAAITLLVGWHSRIAAVIVFVLVVSFERRSPWVFNSGERVDQDRGVSARGVTVWGGAVARRAASFGIVLGGSDAPELADKAAPDSAVDRLSRCGAIEVGGSAMA